MKDIATQANNGTAEYKAFGAEYKELAAEVLNIIDYTQYGESNKLLSAGEIFGAGAVTFQIGSSSSETMSLDASGEVTAMTGAQGALGVIAKQGDAKNAMGLVDTFLDSVGTLRGKFGASINRLDHTINNLGNMNQNIELSIGRIMDADFASESASMTKHQLLMQSGMSVLRKSNQIGGMVMGLLR